MQALPLLLNSTLTILQTLHAAYNITCTFLTIALRDSEMITAKEILCSCWTTDRQISKIKKQEVIRRL